MNTPKGIFPFGQHFIWKSLANTSLISCRCLNFSASLPGSVETGHCGDIALLPQKWGLVQLLLFLKKNKINRYCSYMIEWNTLSWWIDTTGGTDWHVMSQYKYTCAVGLSIIMYILIYKYPQLHLGKTQINTISKLNTSAMLFMVKNNIKDKNKTL